MRIRIADKDLGECIINTNKAIGKSEEYAIKSLCMLQLACMNKDQDPDKFDQLIAILREAVNKAEKVYGTGDEDESDAFDQF